VIVLGVVIFYIDDREWSNVEQRQWIITFISFTKTIFFLVYNYRKITEVSRDNIPYYDFLVFICLNVLLIIFSFAVDYTCLYWINERSFSDIPLNLTFDKVFFEFIYLSMLSYTNFGFAEIMPTTGFAKLLIMLQDIISYAMTIFILADFVSLKDSLKEKLENEKK